MQMSRLVQKQPMRTLLALLGALLCLSAAAGPADTVFLEELTSTEVAARIASGTTTIVIPIGGTEQSGARIALGKHNARVRSLAEEIARKLGHALVAPVVSYVPEGSIEPPSGHMKGAGTISIPEKAFEEVLLGAAASFRKHGFTTVVLLGDHGGYHPSLRRVEQGFNRRAGRRVVIVPAGYYRELEHAGTEDTELTLAVDPTLVRTPAGASLDKGKAARAQIVEATVKALRESPAR
jgi:creatinine amidohydrolase/Fe(II)-dependent formamide hydrolase-like protein